MRRKWPGPRTKGYRGRGWFGIAVLVPAIALALVSEPFVPEETPLAVSLELLAWCAFIAGGAFRLWATLYVGSRKSKVVVTEGPYSLCRNPMYLGTFLLAFSVALFLKSVVVAVAVVAFVVSYAAYTIPAEERLMAHRFPEEYRRYCRESPRWIPRLRGFHTPAILEVDVGVLGREARKMMGWVFLPFVTELVAHLRANPWWPHLLRLP